MYNRYIPQPDGSFRRSHVPDEPAPPVPSPPPPSPEAPPPPKPHPPPLNRQGGFLRQLLPKDFDTADLIVVLLLFLMAGERPEERNNAILTLALYFLM